MRALLLGLALLAPGCGPIEYLNQVTRKASQAVAEAQKADAERWAPYEYWGAVEYLHKAREEAGYADFGVAIELGKKATDLATQARSLAIERAASGPEGAEPALQPAPLPPPPPSGTSPR
jgi:hypothetical protein